MSSQPNSLSIFHSKRIKPILLTVLLLVALAIPMADAFAQSRGSGPTPAPTPGVTPCGNSRSGCAPPPAPTPAVTPCGNSRSGCATLPASTAGASSVCTGSIEYTEGAEKNSGILTDVVGMIGTILNTLLKMFYEDIVKSTAYQVTVYAMLILSVVIYGVMIMFNMASIKPYIVFTRIAKMVIIFNLVNPSPAAWAFYNTYVIGFFLGAMNDTINMFTQLASTGSIGTNTAYVYGGTTAESIVTSAPLSLVSETFGLVVSPKFLALLLGSLSASAVFGVIFFAMLLSAAFGIFRASLGAVMTYVKALVGLTFFLGLGPLFIPLIFFAETKKLFQGWLQQVISLVLQPIMLFAFLAFFLVMIQVSLTSILRQDYCWVSTPTAVMGIPFSVSTLRPSKFNATKGAAEPITQSTPLEYPISMYDIFMFLFLVELFWRYSKYVSESAKAFSSGALSLVVSGGDVRQWIKGMTGGFDMDSVKSYMSGKYTQADNEVKAKEEEYGKIDTQLDKMNAEMDRMKVDNSDQAVRAKKELSGDIAELMKKKEKLGRELGKKGTPRAGGENAPMLDRLISAFKDSGGTGS